MVAKSKIENGTYFLGQENEVINDEGHLGTSDDVINADQDCELSATPRRRSSFILDGQR